MENQAAAAAAAGPMLVALSKTHDVVLVHGATPHRVASGGGCSPPTAPGRPA